MKIKTAQIVALLCLVIIVSASSPANAKDDIFTGSGYTVNFPSGWEISKNTDGMDGIAISPPENEKDTFRENIIIMLEDLPQGMTNKEYIDLSIDNSKKALGGFNVVSRKQITIDGQPGEQMVFEHVYEGTKIKAGQVIVINKGKAYIITLSAIPDTYAAYAPYLESVMKSMKFIK